MEGLEKKNEKKQKTKELGISRLVFKKSWIQLSNLIELIQC